MQNYIIIIIILTTSIGVWGRDMVNNEMQEQMMGVNEMSRLCKVTKKDKIRNEHVRGSVKVAPVPGNRRRGRQKTRWKDLCKIYVECVGLGALQSKTNPC